MTPVRQTNREKFRHQFYEVQDRRCPVCDVEIEWGASPFEHKPSGLLLCRKCYFLVRRIRWYVGPVLDRAIRLIAENKL